jgi:RNA polymerase sigma-70 factor (ECF subfamily)
MPKPPRNPESLADDERWIATILATRDPEAREECYRQLMRKYWKLVTVLATSRLGDPREAEDITQEAFLRAFRSLATLSEPVAFLGWLLRIARNLATDRLRSRRTMVSLDALGEASDRLSMLRPRGESTDHAQSLELEEDALIAMKALDGLPPKYREVLALRYLEGLDGKAMAGLLGEPEGTVRNRLFRALEKLRRSFQLRKAHGR